MRGDTNYQNDDFSTINDSNDNCSDIDHDGHYGFDFNQNHNDIFDQDNANGNFGNHSGNNFSLINNYINFASDNNHDTVTVFYDKLAAILHRFGS